LPEPDLVDSSHLGCVSEVDRGYPVPARLSRRQHEATL
jgi:hypothetical protein